jgi:UDP-N-acetylglucosamine--N-acetylmuramyl-(pentapeptide) pyrophosphoryl-undecaprenol N-acetylglucosamine transferase
MGPDGDAGGMDYPSIILAGGGTGGHIYPALAVAGELRRRRPDLPLLFVGTRAGLEVRLVPEAGFPLRFINSAGIAGKSWPVRVANAMRIPWSLLQSVGIVMGRRAGVVVGVGGYASGPVVLAGSLLRRPTLIMEQNAVAGSTNRILAPLVDRVAVTYPETATRLKGRCQVTGNPVRAGFTALPDRRVAGRPHLLIFGGSRGARGLNDAVMDALPALAGTSNLRIRHQTGSADLERVRAAYSHTALDAEVTPYIEDMAGAYAAADLVICRAGATTIAELSATGRAAVLVPFPGATGGHQEENGRALAGAGAAVLLRQDEAGSGRLAEVVLALLADAPRRRHMEEAATSLGAPEAAATVAGMILELYDRRWRGRVAGNGNPA